jgi:hypothetical protein
MFIAECPSPIDTNEMPRAEDTFFHSKKKYIEINLSYLVLDPPAWAEKCGVV